jgi:hypothetical protein
MMTTPLSLNRQIDDHGQGVGIRPSGCGGMGCRDHRPAGKCGRQDRSTLRGRAGIFMLYSSLTWAGLRRSALFSQVHVARRVSLPVQRRRVTRLSLPAVKVARIYLCRAIMRRGSHLLSLQQHTTCQGSDALEGHLSVPFATRSRSRTHRSDGAISHVQNPFVSGARSV